MSNGIVALHCQWDGSLHPDVFMALIEQPRTMLTPTDKSYKVYISIDVEEDASEERIVSLVSFDLDPERVKREGWIRADDPRIVTALERDGGWGDPNQYLWVQLAPRGTRREDKFYFEHLSVEQRKRFCDLLNEKKLALNYPGYFYTLPFFLARNP